MGLGNPNRCYKKLNYSSLFRIFSLLRKKHISDYYSFKNAPKECIKYLISHNILNYLRLNNPDQSPLPRFSPIFSVIFPIESNLSNAPSTPPCIVIFAIS